MDKMSDSIINLLIAIRENNIDEIKNIVKKGVDINYGLVYCTSINNIIMFDLLISLGANNIDEALSISITQNKSEMTNHIMEKYSANDYSESYASAINIKDYKLATKLEKLGVKSYSLALMDTIGFNEECIKKLQDLLDSKFDKITVSDLKRMIKQTSQRYININKNSTNSNKVDNVMYVKYVTLVLNALSKKLKEEI